MQPPSKPIDLVLMWHMHQPQYEDLISKEFYLPWAYLHGIKDYSDMAFALEQNINARAVINFSTVLLQQIDEYRTQLQQFFDQNEAPRDPLLAMLGATSAPQSPAEGLKIIKQCLRANQKNLIERFPVYQGLCSIAQQVIDDRLPLSYLSEQFLFDLVTWYHIAWMGESIRLHDPRIAKLVALNSEFSHASRYQLLEVIFETIDSLTARYRRLYEAKRIELCFTPLAHPIIPLLLDFDSACQSQQDTLVPTPNYPGGEARSRVHIEQGIALFKRHFGAEPTGCWPAEGGISMATLKLFDQYHLKWTASGLGVLNKSLQQHQRDDEPHQAFQFNGCQIRCFFRDDHLSDLIGFTYHDWDGTDAISNLISKIEQMHQQRPNSKMIVAIILDGENCWEYYHHNGYYFLQALYAYLADHEKIQLTTFSEYLERQPEHAKLPSLVPGSWVYGDFSTWIGHPEKNRGWALLISAKQAYDLVIQTLPETEQELAAEQLAICESSDWFWWLGDYNAPDSVRSFDNLFRLHLKNLYLRLKLTPPAELDHPISKGHTDDTGPENDGVMRRGEYT